MTAVLRDVDMASLNGRRCSLPRRFRLTRDTNSPPAGYRVYPFRDVEFQRTEMCATIEFRLIRRGSNATKAE